MASLFENLDDFSLCLKSCKAILGLDLGTKTIGISVSDTLLTVATPLKTITKIKFRIDSAKIQEIINDRAISGVVLGLPKNMNGTEGPRAQACALGPSVPFIFFGKPSTTPEIARSLIIS